MRRSRSSTRSPHRRKNPPLVAGDRVSLGHGRTGRVEQVNTRGWALVDFGDARVEWYPPQSLYSVKTNTAGRMNMSRSNSRHVQTLSPLRSTEYRGWGIGYRQQRRAPYAWVDVVIGSKSFPSEAAAKQWVDAQPWHDDDPWGARSGRALRTRRNPIRVAAPSQETIQALQDIGAYSSYHPERDPHLVKLIGFMDRARTTRALSHAHSKANQVVRRYPGALYNDVRGAIGTSFVSNWERITGKPYGHEERQAAPAKCRRSTRRRNPTEGFVILKSTNHRAYAKLKGVAGAVALGDYPPEGVAGEYKYGVSYFKVPSSEVDHAKSIKGVSGVRSSAKQEARKAKIKAEAQKAVADAVKAAGGYIKGDNGYVETRHGLLEVHIGSSDARAVMTRFMDTSRSLPYGASSVGKWNFHTDNAPAYFAHALSMIKTVQTNPRKHSRKYSRRVR